MKVTNKVANEHDCYPSVIRCCDALSQWTFSLEDINFNVLCGSIINFYWMQLNLTGVLKIVVILAVEGLFCPHAVLLDN